MSLKACLPDLVTEGKLSQEQADRASEIYDEREAALREQMGPEAAASAASEETLQALHTEHTRKRFLAARTIAAQQALEADLGFGGGGGKGGDGGGSGGGPGEPIDPKRASGLFGYEPGIGFRNVDGLRRAIERRAFSGMAELLQKFHSDALGRMRGVATQRDMVRELFGVETGNADAKALAAAWRDSAEQLRQRFNAAGGDIGKNPDWGLPQGHSTEKVRAAGFDAWRASVLPKLDLAKMVDLRTGLRFTRDSIEPALREVYDTIRTSGWFDRDPGAMGSGSVANRRADPRFLIFKDADSWLEYSDAFGTGEIFHTMVGHVKGMARDIAAMERFGPNPEHGVKLARDMVEKSSRTIEDGGQAMRAANSTLSDMDSLWAEYTGANKRPAKEWLANVGSAVRSYETAKNLGSAIISAVPGDVGTQFIAAKLNKLPFTKVLLNIGKQLNPADAEHRLLANRMGLIYEGWTHHATSDMRGFGDEIAAGTMGRVAESVLRVSGLGLWTDAGHSAAGMTVLGHMADVRASGFGELDSGFRTMMQRHGIGAADWDAIRATPLRSERGSDWLFPQDIADHALGDKVLTMLGNEQDVAVPVNDFATRALANQNLKRGTAIGETAKTALLFKGFGIAMLTNQAKRIAAISSWKGRAGYLAYLTGTMALAGAATLQMREIASGRDMRPMDPELPEGRAFWLAALIQGSGFGIASDILGLMVDPRMGSWAKYLAGPASDTIEDVATTAAKGVHHAAHLVAPQRVQTDANFGGALAKTVTQAVPGGNLWYSRLAFQRTVSDTLSAALDPNYLQARQRTLNRARQNGSGYWWAPGTLAPQRAPDVANAIRTTPNQEPNP